MSDLVKRLRGWPGPRGAEVSFQETMGEAADLIETQSARTAELEAALKKIVEKTRHAHPMSYESGYYRIAHDALEGGGKMSDDLVKRLRNTPNWMREEYAHYKDGLKVFDRAPFEAAYALEAQAARIAELEAALRDVLPYVDTCNSSHREAQAKGYAALEGGKE
jgi:hypothetical protein